MKVNYSGKLYIVHWEHERIGCYTQYGEKYLATKGGTTHCDIQESCKPLATKVAEGSCECSEKDTYCKATGRKVALTRALAGCTNKDFRKAVWEAYRKECRG